MLVPEKLLQKNSSEGVPSGADANNGLEWIWQQVGNERVNICKGWREDWHQGLVTAKSLQLWLQLCPCLYNSMGCSPSGSSVHGILQARILEWVAISFSWGSSQPRA